MTTSIREQVAAAPVFAGLGDGDLDVLAGAARPTHLPAGAAVFREGEPAGHCWLLTTGRVALELAAPGRASLVVATIGAGQLLGWSWLYPPYRWHFDAVAVEATDALVWDAAELRALAVEDPELGHELMARFARIAVQRLQATRLQLLDLYAPPGGDGAP